VGCPRTFPRSKRLNLSYERAFGAYTANQEIDVATQHNFCAANQKRENQTMVPRSPTFRRVSLKVRPASIVEYRLKNCLTLSASSMPSLGFQCATYRMRLPYEQSSCMNFTLYNEQNRRQEMPTDHALETLCFLCWCAPMATTITQIHFETSGGGANRFHGPYSQPRVSSPTLM
jgi:hypothetical protein